MSLEQCVQEIYNVKDETKGYRNTTLAYKNTTESYKDTTLQYRNDALNYKNNSESARNRAESAANRAEAVVIPTGATYSFDDLESALNGLLTQSVAQQAQISILK